MILVTQRTFDAITFTACFFLSAALCFAQGGGQWVMQKSSVAVRLRGVSAVSKQIAWASGDKGTYLHTSDGGATWLSGVVPGAEGLDFRDVDAFSANVAYLLSIGNGENSRIYKTTDGGRNWTLQFKNSNPKAFFDAMAFWDERNGIAVSDPVDGHFVIIRTSDGGGTWKQISPDHMPAALDGEGAFAASGTCIAVNGSKDVWFGTGGPRARVFHSADGGQSWEVAETPMTAGKAAGVFSLLFLNAKQGVAVGGDYTKEKEIGENVAVTIDGGKTWTKITGQHPNGYRSCVAIVPGTRKLVAVGPSGSEYTLNNGEKWVADGTEGFHSISFAGPQEGWAVGENGRVGKWSVYSAKRFLGAQASLPAMSADRRE
jgi:photosystem II stability/assembly factor-like uncharacterized protein